MKKLLLFLFMLCAALTDGRPAFATDLFITNNAILCWFSDSFSVDDTAPITGFRAEGYIHSYLALNYPQFNIYFYNFSRSGGTMDDTLTNRLEKTGLPAWGYQFNNYPHIGIVHATENGALNSNQMYLAISNIFQAPTNMSDGDSTLITQSGWASSNTVQWIGMGDIPAETATGDPLTKGERNNAATNAGWQLGIRGVDIWNPLATAWTNDFNANGGTNVGWFGSPKAGHPGSGGQLSWAFAFLKGITTDTNISTCTVDWSGSVVSTNHCVLSSVNKSGNTLTFNRLDDRLPMAWDAADGTITNDCMGAFRLIPSDADLFRFTLQITNLPAGNYIIKIDGVPVAVLPQSALANGWNMFTNTVGPYWDQRKEVLGRIRDLEYVNRVTLVPGSAADGLGLVSLGSNAQAKWQSGFRGDALISQLDFKVAQVQTNFAAIHAAAQPTNHTFTVTQAAPMLAPFHK